jgi:hypothetical protein
MDEFSLGPAEIERAPSSSVEDQAASTPSIRKGVHIFILLCALAGSVIALILSPIPGASWPLLIILEIFMMVRVARKYFAFKFSASTIAFLVLALLAISSVLTLLIGELIGSLAWMAGIGWFIKMMVAFLVIWGMGECLVYSLGRVVAKSPPS